MGVNTGNQNMQKTEQAERGQSKRAGDGTRTHDSLLGKQTLYQLSYTRYMLCPTETDPLPVVVLGHTA